jgi:hypothetical protein
MPEICKNLSLAWMLPKNASGLQIKSGRDSFALTFFNTSPPVPWQIKTRGHFSCCLSGQIASTISMSCMDRGRYLWFGKMTVKIFEKTPTISNKLLC